MSNLIALREQVPELGIGEIRYDQQNDAVLVAIDGADEPVPLYPDSPTAWATRRQLN